MKKTIIVCLTAIFLGIILTFTAVAAMGNDVIFEGNSQSYIRIDGNNGLFDGFDSLYPGQDFVRHIEVHNPDKETVRIYLHAQSADSEYEPYLHQMSLSVLDENGQTVRNSSDVLSDYLLVDELSRGESRDLQLRLHINKKMNSHFISTRYKTDWVFTAEKDGIQNSLTDTVPQTGSDNGYLVRTFGIIACISLSLMIFTAVHLKSRKDI